MEVKIEPGTRFLIHYMLTTEIEGHETEETPEVRDITILEIAPSGKMVKIKDWEEETWWCMEDLIAVIEEPLPSVASSNPWTMLIKEIEPLVPPTMRGRRKTLV